MSMFGFDLETSHIADSDDATTDPPWELVLSPIAVRRLRESLVQPDEIERTAFVRCFPSGSRLLAAEVEAIPDEEMIRQGRTECRPELAVERREIHETVDAGGVVFHVHSHPFTDLAGFSGADRRIMPKLARWVEQTYGEDGEIIFGVLGRDNLRVTWYDSEREEFTPIPVSVLGGWALDTPLDGATPLTATNAPNRARSAPESDIPDRFDRNLRAFGQAGQQRLLDSEVAVVGVGGLGSSIAEQLSRIGVGTIHLIDPDHLEASNLPRVYGAYEPDIGTPKVEAVRLHLKRINSDLTVTTHESMVEDESETLVGADAVIAGLDRMASRGYLNQFCIRHGLPYFDAGVVINTDDSELDDPLHVTSMDGFIQSVIPGVTACFDCLDRINPQQTRLERLPDEDLDAERERGYIEGTALAPEPAVVTLNTTVAGMVVSEFVNFVTGVRPPRGFIQYEALSESISLLDTEHGRKADCRTCGTNGLLFRGEVSQVESLSLDEAVDTDLESIPTPLDPGTVATESDAVETDGADATEETDTQDDLQSDVEDRGQGDEQSSEPIHESTHAFQYLQEVIRWNR